MRAVVEDDQLGAAAHDHVAPVHEPAQHEEPAQMDEHEQPAAPAEPVVESHEDEHAPFETGTPAEPAWHQFPQTGGVTGLSLLKESHIACHTFPEYRSLCLNVFCCRPRAEWDFSAYLKKEFSARSVSVRRIERPYLAAQDESAGG